MKTTRIVIAGGGFAGLYAAMHFDKRLARRADVEVTLISRENFILFTPMLHEIAAGDLYPGDIVNPLRKMLRRVQVVDIEPRSAASGRGDLRASPVGEVDDDLAARVGAFELGGGLAEFGERIHAMQH